MKKSVQQNLKEVFSNIPNNFAYREVRFHVYQALQKAEKLETREIARKKENKIQEMKYEAQRKAYNNPYYNINDAIKVIDDMIANENKTIESIHAKKIKTVMPNKYTEELLNE